MKVEQRKDHKEYKNSIVLHAKKIFSHFGFEKATMEDIARTLRVGKSTLYYYFRSKISIFEAVMNREAETIRCEIYRAVDEEKTADLRLRAYINTRMKYIIKSLKFYSMLKNEYFKNYDIIEGFRQKFDKEEKQGIIDILSKGIEQGEFKNVDVEKTAASLYFVLKSCELKFWLDEVQEQDIHKSIHNFVEVFIQGIRK